MAKTYTLSKSEVEKLKSSGSKKNKTYTLSKDEVERLKSSGSSKGSTTGEQRYTITYGGEKIDGLTAWGMNYIKLLDAGANPQKYTGVDDAEKSALSKYLDIREKSKKSYISDSGRVVYKRNPIDSLNIDIANAEKKKKEIPDKLKSVNDEKYNYMIELEVDARNSKKTDKESALKKLNSYDKQMEEYRKENKRLDDEISGYKMERDIVMVSEKYGIEPQNFDMKKMANWGLEYGFVVTMDGDSINPYKKNVSENQKKEADILFHLAKTNEIKKNAENHPVATSVGTVVTAPVRSVVGGMAVVDDAIDTATGKEINPYSDLHSVGNATNTIRQTVGDKYASKWFGGKETDVTGNVGKFTYDTLMSMGDNVANLLTAKAIAGGLGLPATQTTALTSKITSGLMSSGATADTIANNKLKGYNDEQALTIGIASGITEYLTEKIPLDRILKTPKTLVKGMLVGFISEGFEEGVSNWGNKFTDYLIAGEDSDISMAIEGYIEDGNSKKDALQKAILDSLLDDARATLSGGFSGMGMSASYHSGNRVKTNIAGRKIVTGKYNDITLSAVLSKGLSSQNAEIRKKAEIIANMEMGDSKKKQYNYKVGELAMDILAEDKYAFTPATKMENARKLTEAITGKVNLSEKSKNEVVETATLGDLTESKLPYESIAGLVKYRTNEIVSNYRETTGRELSFEKIFNANLKVVSNKGGVIITDEIIMDYADAFAQSIAKDTTIYTELAEKNDDVGQLIYDTYKHGYAEKDSQSLKYVSQRFKTMMFEMTSISMAIHKKIYGDISVLSNNNGIDNSTKSSLTNQADTSTMNVAGELQDLGNVVDAIEDSFKVKARLPFYSYMQKQFGDKHYDDFAKIIVENYLKTGSLGQAEKYFKDGGRNIIQAIENIGGRNNESNQTKIRYDESMERNAGESTHKNGEGVSRETGNAQNSTFTEITRCETPGGIEYFKVSKSQYTAEMKSLAAENRKKYGVNTVYFSDSAALEDGSLINGFYLDGTLYLQCDDIVDIRTIRDHEITHHYEKSEAFTKFLNSVKSKMPENEFEAWKQEIHNIYGESLVTYLVDEFKESGGKLTNDDLQKLKDDYLEAEMMANLNAGTVDFASEYAEEIATFRSEIDMSIKSEQLTVDTSAKIGNKINEYAEEMDAGGVKYAIRNDNKGVKYWEIETGKDIFKNINDRKTLQKTAFNYILKGDKGKIVNEIIEGKPLTFTRISAEEYVYGVSGKKLDESNYKKKMRMAPSITDLIENASVEYDTPDHKNHKFAKDGFKNYRGRVRIDEVIFEYVVRVGKNTDKNMFYDINLEVESILPSTKVRQKYKNDSTSNDSLPQNDISVNNNSMQNSAKNTEKEKYSFAGFKARTADIDSYGKAVEMDKKGRDIEEIWKETGWTKGRDGKFRFEIDDSKYEFNLEGYVDDPVKVEHFVKHDELFEAYPSLRNIPVLLDENLDIDDLGVYRAQFGENGLIILNPNWSKIKLKKVMLHELQHAIQIIEGFTPGATVEYWRNKLREGDYSEDMQQFIETAKFFGVSPAALMYEQTAGEIEARDVEDRMDFSTKKRKETFPYSMDDSESVLFADNEEAIASKNNKQNGVMWTMEDDVLTRREIASFYEKVSELRNNQYHNYVFSNEGQYIFAIGNKMVFTDGDYDYPEISTVISFNTENETELYYLRKDVYDAEKAGYGHRYATQIIEAVYGEEFVSISNIGNIGTNENNTGRTKGSNGRETDSRSRKDVKTVEKELFTASSDVKNKLSNQIERWLNGEMNSNEIFEFGNTPIVLRELGARNLPVVMSQSTMTKINGEKHNISLENIRNMPQNIADPLMVFKSATVPNAFVILTQMEDIQGDTVIVALHMNKIENRLNVNRIASIYGKYNVDSFISGQIKNGNLKYIDKIKSQEWSTSRGLQLPKLVQSNPDNNSILQKEDIVKKYYMKNQKTYSNSGKVKMSISNTGTTTQDQIIEIAKEKVYRYNELIKKPDMKVSSINDTVSLTPDGKIERDSVIKKAIQNIRSKRNAKNTLTNSYVYVKDIDIDVLVGKRGLVHGLSRSAFSTAQVTENIADILENAILINELESRNSSAGGYVLLGIGTDSKGNYYPTRIIVNNYEISDVEVLDVVYGVNAKKKNQSPNGAELPADAVPPIKGSSTIKISDLLYIVKDYFADILPSDVLQKYNMQRPKSTLSGSVKYSITTSQPKSELDRKWEETVDKYGSIESGANPVRDIKVPKKSDKERYVSKSARTLLEAEIMPDNTVDEFRWEVLNHKVSHISITDKDARKYALDKIQELGFDGVIQYWNAIASAENIPGKNDIVLGEILLNQCLTAADVELSMKIAGDLAHIATRAGQATQAFSMIKKMSPDGKLYCLEKSIQSLNREMNEQLRKTGTEIILNVELARQYLTEKDETRRQELLDEIHEDIAKQIPSTRFDKWTAWRYLSLLCNPKTHFKNVVGNAIMVPTRKLKNFIGALLESGVVALGSMEENQRTKSIIRDRSALEFAKKDFDKVGDLIKGYDGKYDIKYGEINERRQIFKNRYLEAVRRFNNKAMEWEDGLFLRASYVDALAQVMTARGITPEFLNSGTREALTALDNIRKYAIKEAQEATFRDANEIAKALNKGRQWATKKGGTTKFIWYATIEGVLPFKNTPLNIAQKGIEYSPAYLIKVLTTDIKAVKNGKMTADQMLDDIAKGFSGTALVLIGSLLAHLGWIIGAGDEDKKKKKFDETIGFQGYALKLGEFATYTIDWAAPSVMPIFVGVELWNSIKEDGISFADFTGAMSKIAEPIMELSCLQGIASVLEAAMYYEENALSAVFIDAATSYIMQAVPSLPGQIARTVDKTRRTTYVNKNSHIPKTIQTLSQKIAAKIPTASYMLEPRIDAWGKEMTYGENIVMRGVSNFISPGYARKIDNSKVSKELNALYGRSGESSIFPTIAQKSVTIGPTDEKKYGKLTLGKINLTGEQYTFYAKSRGQHSLRLVTELINSPDYKIKSDEEKVEAIEDCYKEAGKIAKEEFIKKYLLEK